MHYTGETIHHPTTFINCSCTLPIVIYIVITVQLHLKSQVPPSTTEKALSSRRLFERKSQVEVISKWKQSDCGQFARWFTSAFVSRYLENWFRRSLSIVPVWVTGNLLAVTLSRSPIQAHSFSGSWDRTDRAVQLSCGQAQPTSASTQTSAQCAHIVILDLVSWHIPWQAV